MNRTSEVQAPEGFLQNVLQFNPSLPVYDINGNYAGPVGGYPDRENPVARLDRNSDNRYTYWRMFGDAYINLNPFKGFNIRSTLVWIILKSNNVFLLILLQKEMLQMIKMQ